MTYADTAYTKATDLVKLNALQNLCIKWQKEDILSMEAPYFPSISNYFTAASMMMKNDPIVKRQERSKSRGKSSERKNLSRRNSSSGKKSRSRSRSKKRLKMSQSPKT